MNTNLSIIFDILNEVEIARNKSCRRAFGFLSPRPSSAIACILTQKENEPWHNRLIPHLKKVSNIVEEHRVQWNITDWPFENFWGNPYEPRHSKLLGYFIDPAQSHGCGSFLLGKLLQVLENSLAASGCSMVKPHHFPAEGCQIHVESQNIDLWIERRSDQRKYAIMIENKINWAINRDKQLQTYVERIREHGFEYGEIYVFYLPLTIDKDSDFGDRTWLKERGVSYTKVTFKEHIFDWLNAAIGAWVPSLPEGMRENLSHYRSLIIYLNKKQKELEMNVKILDRLKEAEDKQTLPTLSDIDSLMESTDSLRQCLLQVLRGKLLLQIRALLIKSGEGAWLFLGEEPTDAIDFDSPYDHRFEKQVNVCLAVNKTVCVCFGADAKDSWFGYVRGGSADSQKEIEREILLEAEERLKGIGGKNFPWYAWSWTKVNWDDACVKNHSTILAKTLVDMRCELANRLKLKGAKL